MQPARFPLLADAGYRALRAQRDISCSSPRAGFFGLDGDIAILVVRPV
jgi:hypothetical protein